MITEAQKRVISMIENNLNIKFQGSTKEETRKFISSHMEQSRAAAAEYKQNQREIYQRLKFEETHEYDRRTDSYRYIDAREFWDEEDAWDDYAERLVFDPNFG